MEYFVQKCSRIISDKSVCKQVYQDIINTYEFGYMQGYYSTHRSQEMHTGLNNGLEDGREDSPSSPHIIRRKQKKHTDQDTKNNLQKQPEPSEKPKDELKTTATSVCCIVRGKGMYKKDYDDPNCKHIHCREPLIGNNSD